MAISPLAGKPVPQELLVDLDSLCRDYYEKKPNLEAPTQLVSFGTSGHRGTSQDGTFTESHILAVVQAVCDYRRHQGYKGPLYLGKDTHALSGPAQETAIEVLAANNVETIYQRNNGYTPTPVISHAILKFNAVEGNPKSDGIVITPSHNPPNDGGIKYNGPDGGPADTEVTTWIQNRANEYLRENNRDVSRTPYKDALRADCISGHDLSVAYIADLENIIEFPIIARAGLKIGVDPLGGAGVHYWEPIAERYGLDITVVNKTVDPQFGFMTVDHDGKVRMDCSSSYAMAKLVSLKDKFDLAFANDPDADRHGIVAPSVGLLNPNHYLAVAIQYLFTHRESWHKRIGIGKTLVSSSIIDRLAQSLNRPLIEVPVGFKWFVRELINGKIGFGGEESAGASFLRFNGDVWTTDKDGLILNLLAAEIIAKTGKDPGLHYQHLESLYGRSCYTRIDQAASPEQKAAFKNLTPEKVAAAQLAGEPILDKLVNAPGNGAPIGGLKVVAANGWFAARPSGTENIYKIYAESFQGESHLEAILKEATEIVNTALG